MSKASQNLTVGSLPRQILFFSIPLIASNLLQVLFNMADLAVVGRFAGAEALGAVGSTTILVCLFTTFVIGVGSGINVLAARYFGAGEQRDLSQTVHTAFWLSVGVGVFLALGGVLGAPLILTVMGTKQELYPGALLYLRIYFCGMPALSLFNFGNGVYSAVGNTRKPLFYLTSAGALNVVLNLLFVIGFCWDVAGVAVASITSQYLSAALIVAALFRTEESYGLSLRLLRVDRRKLRQLLGLCIPAGIQNAIFQIANLFVQAGVNTFDAVVVEGIAAATNTDALVYDTMAAFYTACSSFVGQNYGAGKPERMGRSYRISMAYSFGAAALLGLTILAFGRQFLGLFTTESAVIEAGMHRLTIMCISYPISAFMDCTIAASRGLGKTAVPLVIVFMGSCVFRLVWIATVFAFFRTVTSLYLLYMFSWTFTAIAEIIYYRRIYRESVAIFAK